MKNIAKFNILITTFTLLFSSDSIAQYDKRQIVQDSKINSDRKTENYSKESSKNYGKFYFGFDAFLQESLLNGNIKNPNDYYEPKTSAMSIFTGYDNQDFFKIEGFYSKSNEKNQITNANGFSTYELISKTAGVDFKPYLNFDKDSRALFYLIFGLNYSKMQAKEFNQTNNYGIFGSLLSSKTNSRNSSLSKVFPTFGVGVEYLFYRNFVLRFQYKRNFVDAKITNSEVLNKIKIIETLGVGISHSF